MRLMSTDLSSLTAIAFGAAVGVGLSALFITGQPESASVDPVFLLDPALEAESDVHHDFERTRRILVRSAEDAGGNRPALVLESGEPAPPEAPQALEADELDLLTSPIIFVDGVRVMAFPDLSSDEIDRIEVLKGEEALYQFGLAAEGGVIQIFTKSATAPNPGR